jgi:two-component system, NtrC family, sensor kinase
MNQTRLSNPDLTNHNSSWLESPNLSYEQLLSIAKDQQKVIESQQILSNIVDKIRSSLDLDIIFRTTTEEVRNCLKADRVVIYRFNEDWSGEYLFESVNEEQKWKNLLEQQWLEPEIKGNISECSLKDLAQIAIKDSYLQETKGGNFTKGETYRVCVDVDKAGFSDCYLQILKTLDAKSYVIAGIYQEQKLWGLLAVYQNTQPRCWEDYEIKLLTQIASQLAIALTQAELFIKTASQAEELTQALAKIKQTQAYLIQTEKMAGLGQLVAGIAHEINNPINFIYGNISHLKGYSEDLLELVELYDNSYPEPQEDITDFKEDMELEYLREDLPKVLQSVEIGTKRIREIVLSLRSFSRLDEAEKKSVNIHEGIDNTLLILQHRLKAKDNHPTVSIIKSYGDIPLIECYAAQLNQVFMNIISNGIDALEEYKIQEPKLTIKTELVNNFVNIYISDNANGIPETIQKKIFDPFFTTKDIGKGTGLGLAISYQIIVEKHQGKLTCSSIMGEGTTFCISIPLSK